MWFFPLPCLLNNKRQTGALELLFLDNVQTRTQREGPLGNPQTISLGPDWSRTEDKQLSGVLALPSLPSSQTWGK